MVSSVCCTCTLQTQNKLNTKEGVVFWKIYTAGTNFTRPPVATVVTNLNSAPSIAIHCHLTHHPLSSIVILLTIHCHILLWPIPSPAASSLCSCTSWEGNLWDLGKIKTKTDENVWKYIRNMWTYLKIYQNIWKYPAPAGNVTFEKTKNMNKTQAKKMGR